MSADLESQAPIPTAIAERIANAVAIEFEDMAECIQAAGFNVGTEEFRVFLENAIGGGLATIAHVGVIQATDTQSIYGMGFGHGLYLGALAARAADRQAADRG